MRTKPKANDTSTKRRGPMSKVQIEAKLAEVKAEAEHFGYTKGVEHGKAHAKAESKAQFAITNQATDSSRIEQQRRERVREQKQDTTRALAVASRHFAQALERLVLLTGDVF